jgi:hypothetical protein
VSEFRVQTSLVADHAARLSAIGTELGVASGSVAAGAGAAASTGAAPAVEQMTSHLSSRLPEFGVAAEALRRAMLAAAAAYAKADASVERSAR